VESLVFTPGPLHVNRHGSVLDATDVLLNGAYLPWNRKTIVEKCGRDGRAQKDTQVGNETVQRVEHRHDLRGVTESMS
jgi:hypothetical protein